MKILSIYQACTKGADGKLPECDYTSAGVSSRDIQLFEASGDLLAALQEFLRIDDESHLYSDDGSDLVLALDAARKAIAKAIQ